MAEWYKALSLTACCHLPLPMFKSRPRQLVWEVIFAGYSGFPCHLKLAIHNLALI